MTLSFSELRAIVEQYRKEHGTFQDKEVAPIFYIKFPSEGERVAALSRVEETVDDTLLVLDIAPDGRVLGIEFF